MNTIRLIQKSFIILPLFAFMMVSGQQVVQKTTETKKDEVKKKINWVSIEEAQELNKKEPRKIMIDLYTNWCGWCKRMDATTFSQNDIVEYVNENYYAVKLNAETKDTIQFNGHTFVNRNPQARRPTHEIASIGAGEDGRLGYPTIVYLDEDLNRISVLPGFKSAKDIEPILKYIAGEHYKETPWDKFMEEFKPKVKE